MPEHEIAPQVQESEDATPQEGQSAEPSTIDPAIRELRRENQNLRARFREAEAKLREYEASQLTEQEWLARELEELRAERDALRDGFLEGVRLRARSLAEALRVPQAASD